ncbi:hypothetical protein TWF281_006178 [Arthrobotrys megalospora]
MNIWSILYVLTVIGLALGVDGVLVQTKEPGTLQGHPQRNESDVPHQVYMQYPLGNFENGTVRGPELQNTQMRKVVDAAANFWNGHPEVYCTTFYKHDSVNETASYGSIFCRDNISIGLYNRRQASIGLPNMHVRVFCKDVAAIAVETMNSIEAGAAKLGGFANYREIRIPGNPKGTYQWWLTGSHWSDDNSWEVNITLYEGGCPKIEDRIQNAVLTTDPEDITYIILRERKGLRWSP